jgi:AcrR family transcriptional regulator
VRVNAQWKRSDARDNRVRILAAARDALVEDGSASLSEIARRAEVGIGTLYRNFPTRESLVLEVYRDDLDRLIALAPELLREHPPLDALQRWLDEVGHYARLKYGISEIVHAATNGGLDDPAYDPFVAAIGTLLTAGAKAGELKPGLDPEDVLLQLSVLWRLDPARHGRDRTDRILRMIIDGLKPH